MMRLTAARLKDARFPQFAVQIGSPTPRSAAAFAVPDPNCAAPLMARANHGMEEVIMSHRLFAQLEFERALGNAAISALKAALNEKKSFDAETAWPKEPPFKGRYDIDAIVRRAGPDR